MIEDLNHTLNFAYKEDSTQVIFLKKQRQGFNSHIIFVMIPPAAKSKLMGKSAKGILYN